MDTRNESTHDSPKANADIGLIGLAVMGESLVLNMESRGYTVAVYNRTTAKVDAFVASSSIPPARRAPASGPSTTRPRAASRSR